MKYKVFMLSVKLQIIISCCEPTCEWLVVERHFACRPMDSACFDLPFYCFSNVAGPPLEHSDNYTFTLNDSSTLNLN